DVIQHYVGTYWYGVVEAEGEGTSGANDDFETAETLTTPAGASAEAYFVDGNLVDGTDVDWFVVEAPDGISRAGISCHVQRAGSGLRGFTAELFAAEDDEPGAKVVGATDVATEGFGVAGAASAGRYFLKLSAA